MSTKQTTDQSWTALELQWRNQSVDLQFSEGDLQLRLRRQRMLVVLMAVAEALSLVLALGVAFWMSQYELTGRFGRILIVWLIAQAAVVFWMRRRQSTAYDGNVIERIDASIEHDDRMVESLRLGSLMGSIALASIIVAVVVSLHLGSLLASPASAVLLGSFFVYVFAVQIAIIVYARRVRRRRERFESIRRSLRALE